jgi:hypothetical protein
LLEAFPYEELVRVFFRRHHEWKNNFLLPSLSRFIELALHLGPLHKKLDYNDLERRTS